MWESQRETSKIWTTLRFLESKDTGNNRRKSWCLLTCINININIKFCSSHCTPLLPQKLKTDLTRFLHTHMSLSLLHAFSICVRKDEKNSYLVFIFFHKQLLPLISYSVFCCSFVCLFFITRYCEFQHIQMRKQENTRKTKGCFSSCFTLEMAGWPRLLISERNIQLWNHRMYLSV